MVVRAAERATVERLLRNHPREIEVEVRSGLAVVSLIGSPMRGEIGFAARVFACLAEEGINVLAIAQTASERNISVIVAGGQDAAAVRALHQGFVEGR